VTAERVNFDTIDTIDLREFGSGDKPLSVATGRFLAECASVCLAHHGHASETRMIVAGMRTDVIRLNSRRRE
jgi:hypothetical protein